MPDTILALDHVNIVAADLAASARFYVTVLGLEERDAPPPLTPQNSRWLYDRDGRAVIHLNSRDCPRRFDRTFGEGPTGSLHHVAFRCADYAGTLAHLKALGIGFETNAVPAVGLRQLFLSDLDGVLLELNFFA